MSALGPRYVSACLITKDAVYPPEILAAVGAIGFGEILIKTHCDSPHRKQELFTKAACDYLYYQDDDCIAPITQLFEACKPNMITCAMKASHIASYANSPIALLGWGSIFPKRAITVLDWYRATFGEDKLYCRETERIMTYLYGRERQQRLDLPIHDLPSALAPDRLSMQPDHYSYIPIVEQRCASILANEARL